MPFAKTTLWSHASIARPTPPEPRQTVTWPGVSATTPSTFIALTDGSSPETLVHWIPRTGSSPDMVSSVVRVAAEWARPSQTECAESATGWHRLRLAAIGKDRSCVLKRQAD